MKCLIVMAISFLMLASARATTISFFEELPNETTGEKTVYLGFDTKLYLAARNISEFLAYAEQIKTKSEHVKEVVYWPILDEEEGYWISPWSDPKALQRIFTELVERQEPTPLEVMLDLEFPKKKMQVLTRWNSRKENWQTIEQFLQEAPEKNMSVITVEKSYFPGWLLRTISMSFPSERYGNRRMQMYYTSFQRPFLPEALVDAFYQKKVWKAALEGTALAIGLVAPGIYGTEPTYSGTVLEKELQWAAAAHVSEVVIFRLEGLNEEVKTVLQKFTPAFIPDASQTTGTAAPAIERS